MLSELPNGETRQFDYVNGQMVRHQDHGRVTDVTYDDSGRIVSLSGAQNHAYTYDPAGQLVQAVQDDGTYSYGYGPRGEVTSIIDPDRSRTFTHNANVEIAGIVDSEGRAGGVTYDAAGRMIEHVDPDGTVTTYVYDARGLLVEETITGPGEITAVGRQEPDPNAVCDAPGDECGALGQSGGLYRVRNGDPGDGESASQVFIERDVAAAAQLGIIDADPDGDGWAVVGRSNGAGDDGIVANDWMTDGAPFAAIRHHNKGCLTVTPSDLGPVTVGSVRTLTGTVDTANCRAESPSADVDDDGTPDDQQALFEVVDTGSRLLLYRNITAAEAQLGVSDWDDDGDGLALFARTNGSGEYGTFQELSGDPIAPRVSAVHGRKGCQVLEPNRTDTVATGQTRRLVVTDRPGGETCPPFAVAPTGLTVSRSVNGDGQLVARDYGDSASASRDDLLWDPTSGISELLQVTTDGATETLVHGWALEIEDSNTAEHTALGDVIVNAPHQSGPFGTPQPVAHPAIGYRGELQLGALTHLRARNLRNDLGTFTTRDPLDGVAGTTTYTNPYHYADNDPIGRIDPLGLRSSDAAFDAVSPSMSAQELAALDAYVSGGRLTLVPNAGSPPPTGTVEYAQWRLFNNLGGCSPEVCPPTPWGELVIDLVKTAAIGGVSVWVAGVVCGSGGCVIAVAAGVGAAVTVAADRLLSELRDTGFELCDAVESGVSGAVVGGTSGFAGRVFAVFQGGRRAAQGVLMPVLTRTADRFGLEQWAKARALGSGLVSGPVAGARWLSDPCG